MPILHFRDQQIPYDLKPSRKRRTLALQVTGQSQVTLFTPQRMPVALIESFLQARAGWLVEKLRYFEEMGRQHPPKMYRPGEAFLVSGQPYILDVQVDAAYRRPRVERVVSRLVVQVSAETKVRTAMLKWYKAQAEEIVQEAISRLAPLLNVFPKRISIANQKRRWGSCSSQGDLRFNWRLAMMPEPIADYIVVHELAHMRVPSHSAKFWSCVQVVLPDYKERRRWLRANALQFS